MKKRMTLSLLAIVTVLSCVLGGVTVANAQEPTVIYTAVACTDGDYEHFNSVELALSKAAEKNRTWGKNEVLEIRFDGTFVAGGHNGVLFNATTIWREDGTKLPIIIRGKSRESAVIDFDNAGGFYACANDYTFTTCTLTIGNDGTSLFAGSGDVTFVDCALQEVTKTRIEVQDKTKQAQLIRISKAVAEAIATESGADVIPALEAWESVINDATSPFYDAELGYVLRGMASTGQKYGDWTHDGDVGGGQYLNACIVFEVITKTSCVGNSFVPDYQLKYGGTWRDLQELAHKTVVAYYGEDYFAEPVSAGEDGVFNVLFPGSSTSYYYADELASLGYHAGYKMKVVNPYISSLTIKQQWENYVQPEKPGYAERVWVDSGSGAVLTSASNKTLQEIVPKEKWDAIFLYTGTSSYDNYFKDFTEDYLKEEQFDAYIERVLADHTGAKPTYDYLKASCPEARMLWFSSPVGPVGAFGSSTEITGFVFGDNCFDGVYAGWTAEDLKDLSSSVTFSDGTEYIGPYTSGTKGTIRVAASGYLKGDYKTAHTDETAREVKFIASGMENVPDVRPVDTHASLILDGDGAALYNVSAKLGGSPCDTTVWLREGTVQSINGDDHGDSPAAGPIDELYGDITLKVTGGNVASYIDVLWDANLRGDVNLHIEPLDGPITGITRVRGAFGTGNSEALKGVINGDSTTLIRDVSIAGSLHLGGCNGVVKNTVENVTLSGSFIGQRVGTAESIENNLKNVTVQGSTDSTIAGSVMGTYGTMVKGDIVNNLENCTFEQNYHGGNYSGIVSGDIVNNLKNCTVKGNYYGGNYMSVTKGSIRNNISGGVFNESHTADVRKDSYMGNRSTASRDDAVNGQIVNNIDGTIFKGHTLFGGGCYGTLADSKDFKYRIENTLNNVTAQRFSGAGQNTGMPNATIKNEFTGTNTISYVYCGSMGIKVDTVESHVKGKVTGTFYFGTNTGAVNALYNYIEDGAELGSVYAGSNTSTSATASIGESHTYIKGGKVTTFYGGSRDIPQKGEIFNTVEGGEVTNFYGGSAKKNLTGNITNVVTGGTINSFTAGSTGGGTLTGNITNTLAGGKINTSFRGGNNTGCTLVGKITNTVTGGTVDNYLILAGYGQISLPEGSTEEYVVESTVSGGTFKGAWGGGEGATGALTGNIKTTVTGGTFKPYSLTDESKMSCLNAANRNMKHLSGKAELVIYDGVFEGEVCAGSYPNSSGSSFVHDDPNATAEITVYGGTFHMPILANSKWCAAKLGKVVLDLSRSDITLYSTFGVNESSSGEQIYEIVGGEHSLLLGKDAALTATEAEGTIRLLQTEGWQMQDYLTLPAGNTAKVITKTADGATGAWTAETGGATETLRIYGTDLVKTPAAKATSPTLSEAGTDFIALTAEEGYEYSLDGATWQESATFTGLESGKAYTFYRRLAESATALTGEASDGATFETKSYVVGDMDGSGSVDSDDAIYLLFYTLFEEDYPIDQPADFDGSGEVDSDDAIYLLFHTLFEEDYPL